MTGNTKLYLTLRKNIFIFMSILKSFDTAAYYVLWIKFLQVLFLPFDLLLFAIEKVFVNKGSQPEYPIVFVVGIQRTGSTFVSQVLADAYPFIPLGNFATIFSRSRYYIHKLFNVFYPRLTGQNIRKRRRKYTSYYGISKGIFTISDSYEVWDRWFGKNHYTVPDSMPAKTKEDLLNYFTCLQKAFNKPVITKNNRNSLAIKLLNEIFPSAFFVVVNRRPSEVIQSTVRASYDFFGNGKYLWGLVADDDFNMDNYEDLVDAACHQYVELEKLIYRQLDEIDPKSYIVVEYEDFCKKPAEYQSTIYEMIGNKTALPQQDLTFETKTFDKSKRLKDTGLQDKINSTLLKYTQKVRNT